MIQSKIKIYSGQVPFILEHYLPKQKSDIHRSEMHKTTIKIVPIIVWFSCHELVLFNLFHYLISPLLVAKVYEDSYISPLACLFNHAMWYQLQSSSEDQYLLRYYTCRTKNTIDSHYHHGGCSSNHQEVVMHYVHESDKLRLNGNNFGSTT